MKKCRNYLTCNITLNRNKLCTASHNLYVLNIVDNKVEDIKPIQDEKEESKQLGHNGNSKPAQELVVEESVNNEQGGSHFGNMNSTCGICLEKRYPVYSFRRAGEQPKTASP